MLQKVSVVHRCVQAKSEQAKLLLSLLEWQVISPSCAQHAWYDGALLQHARAYAHTRWARICALLHAHVSAKAAAEAAETAKIITSLHFPILNTNAFTRPLRGILVPFRLCIFLCVKVTRYQDELAYNLKTQLSFACLCAQQYSKVSIFSLHYQNLAPFPVLASLE